MLGTEQRNLRAVQVFTTLIFMTFVLLLSWHSDDAYHGYIMSRNLVNGHGLVYNLGERVNASTCPLFTLIIAGLYFVTREMFVSGILAGLIFSSLAFWLLVTRFCKTGLSVIFSGVLLLTSASFMSYSTSGLENPLLFFLSAGYLAIYFSDELFSGKKLFLLALCVGLIATTRMDQVILFAVPSVWIYLFKRKNVSFFKAVGIAILGLMPFILWEAFSVFYYGFFFPNTAYIKLGTAIGQSEYFVRGLSYYLATTIFDLVIVVTILVYLVVAFLRKNVKNILIAISILMYLGYLIYIGGDFMVGRFFTMPFMISICALQTLSQPDHQTTPKEGNEAGANREHLMQQGIMALLMVVILYNVAIAPLIAPIVLYQGKLSILHLQDIADERRFYFPHTSTLSNLYDIINGTPEYRILHTWDKKEVEQVLADGKKAAVLHFAPGILVYEYIERLYLLDAHGLGDPLLARLPAIYEADWRVGHISREIPAGYIDTLNTGVNHIEDASLAEYYNVLSLIVRGDLFSSERIKAVLDINLGRYDDLLAAYADSQHP